MMLHCKLIKNHLCKISKLLFQTLSFIAKMMLPSLQTLTNKSLKLRQK